MNDVLYIIAKAPRAGFAKTRLGDAIGHERAIALYEAFLQDMAAKFGDAPFGLGWYVTPRGAWPEISALTGDTERLLHQGDGDLTERQRALFREAARRGERAVLVGSDVPHLSVETVEEAFQALDTHDVALTPTYDGGYCLIGMSEPHEELLEGLEMSTGSELDGITACARNSGLTVKLLDPTFDVDEEEDLQDLRKLVLRRKDLAATRDALETLDLLEDN